MSEPRHHITGRLIRCELTTHLNLCTITAMLAQADGGPTVTVLRSYPSNEGDRAARHMQVLQQWRGMQVRATGRALTAGGTGLFLTLATRLALVVGPATAALAEAQAAHQPPTDPWPARRVPLDTFGFAATRKAA
jgi:hypothetical protein